MIVTTIGLELVLIVVSAFYYDNLPMWAKILCPLTYSAIHLIACISEDNLREKIKRLEAEVKKLKKDGE